MKFIIVAVLYNKKITDLPYYSLFDQLFQRDISIICYDNSPFAQSVSIVESHFHYYHDEKNSGIAAAYNYALKMANKNHVAALLLLDHDTQLTLELVDMYLATVLDDKLVAAVPRVVSNGEQISPVDASQYINHSSKAIDPGIYSNPLMAINSGSLISVAFLNELGGFNQSFPLDFLDHWLFYEISQHGKKVLILDTSLDHDLSVQNYQNVSHTRYNSIIDSETKYYSNYRTDLLQAHKIQLLKRTMKQFVKESDRFFWKRTIREFKKIWRLKM
ncbi:glycosyltransferase [Lapidilactobacillus mulanensis]|uniref:Glycosyltransferase n=1 Tax=Lapidilactobacillus mulanensis TaxID=2485999 RepID=A0ABW4DT07_9LACO|nr:glycosyltransferase [Lapidilactobacillus mulanensis]